MSDGNELGETSLTEIGDIVETISQIVVGSLSGTSIIAISLSLGSILLSSLLLGFGFRLISLEEFEKGFGYIDVKITSLLKMAYLNWDQRYG